MEQNKPEIVYDSETLHIKRIEVPNGWLYITVITGINEISTPLSTTFVPDTIKQNQANDEYRRNLMEKIKVTMT